jgi:hypothetical protein
MPLSYPPIRAIEIDGQTRWQATCRTCGEDVCTRPQVVKAAVQELRKAHGAEADCTRPRARQVEPDAEISGAEGAAR